MTLFLCLFTVVQLSLCLCLCSCCLFTSLQLLLPLSSLFNHSLTCSLSLIMLVSRFTFSSLYLYIDSLYSFILWYLFNCAFKLLLFKTKTKQNKFSFACSSSLHSSLHCFNGLLTHSLSLILLVFLDSFFFLFPCIYVLTAYTDLYFDEYLIRHYFVLVFLFSYLSICMQTLLYQLHQ